MSNFATSPRFSFAGFAFAVAMTLVDFCNLLINGTIDGLLIALRATPTVTLPLVGAVRSWQVIFMITQWQHVGRL